MEERTGKTPPALLEMPRVDETTSWYLDTFFTLSSSRQTGMSLGRIPLSEITNYALVFGTIEDDLKTFCIVISAMDSEYLKFQNSKSAK